MAGSVPEKIFRLAAMKNRLLQGFVGENGSFLEPEWH